MPPGVGGGPSAIGGIDPLGPDDMLKQKQVAKLVAAQTAFNAQMPDAERPMGATGLDGPMTGSAPIGPGYASGGLTPAQMHVMGRGAATDAGRVKAATKGPPGMSLIHSNVPGRVDRIPMKARTGSYVLPADVVSGLGQGNTTAGAKMWGDALAHGVGGVGNFGGGGKMKTARAPTANAKLMAPPKISYPKPVTTFAGDGKPKLGFADGGDVEADEAAGYTPIITAGGEGVIDPEVVAALGDGDPEAGKAMLNESVAKVRKQLIEHLKSLPGPVE